MTTPARSATRRGPVAAVLAGAALLLAACAGPRSSLNTTTSQCFRALPMAKAIVSQQGKLVGVRSVSGATLARQLPQAERLSGQQLCLVAFRGPYPNGSVPRADPAGPGTYAIVAVDRRGSTVLASFVVDELPLRFRHPI